MQNVARRLVALLTDLSLQKHPIFFHAFSNGGAFLYQHVSEEINRSGGDLRVSISNAALLKLSTGDIGPKGIVRSSRPARRWSMYVPIRRSLPV